MSDPVFITRDVILYVHRKSLEQHGGIDGLREPGLLDSALMQPEAAYYYGNADLATIAAAYAFHIAQNQPFLDGNKRTAIGAALIFLALNGCALSTDADDQFYDALIAIAERRMDKAGLAQVFRDATGE